MVDCGLELDFVGKTSLIRGGGGDSNGWIAEEEHNIVEEHCFIIMIENLDLFAPTAR